MLTFLGEWGDKSQFSTITMAAAGDSFYVFLGASSALFLSTLSAVLAGQLISKHISESKMNLAGGILFLLFGLLTTYNIYQQWIWMDHKYQQTFDKKQITATCICVPDRLISEGRFPTQPDSSSRTH